MKTDTSRTLFSFLIELVIYSFLVVVYFFLILHFLGDWLQHLSKENIKLYAVVAIALIIGQAILLEWVTTFLFRLLRGRSE
jgi:fructose-specific phosphotransferase system IIC component